MRELKNLFFQKFKSEYHSKKWAEYEKVLMVRTTLQMISRVILGASFVMQGKETFNLTEDLIDSGNAEFKNQALAATLLPYARTAVYMH